VIGRALDGHRELDQERIIANERVASIDSSMREGVQADKLARPKRWTSGGWSASSRIRVNQYATSSTPSLAASIAVNSLQICMQEPVATLRSLYLIDEKFHWADRP
jgi:hypothetical protein